MAGIEYGHIHLEDGKVVGVRRHSSPPPEAVLYEASLEKVLPMLESNGWYRSDSEPIPATGYLKIQRESLEPPTDTEKRRVAVCPIEGPGTLQEQIDSIRHHWESNGWDLIEIWEKGGLNFGPRMFFSKPASSPDGAPFKPSNLKP